MPIDKLANKVVDELDSRQINVYITLAKYGLWFIAVMLVCIVLSSVLAACSGNPLDASRIQIIGVVVQACQVGAMICITILGWHGYRGSRVFHVLRNLYPGGGK